MRVIKNYLYNAAYQVFILIVPLVTTPYLSRVLGPTGVGINSYTNSIIQYFILLGSIGVNLYGNREIAYVREDKSKLSQTFYEIFLMRSVAVIISYIAFLIFLSFMNQYNGYYLAQSVSLIAVMFDISWFFMGVENFLITVLRNFIVKIITLILIFTMVKSSNDLIIYILILSLSLLLGNMTLFPSLKHYIGLPNFKSMKIKRHIIPSIMLFAPQVAIQVYSVVNKTMLGAMISVQAAGYFEQSDKIVKMVLAIVTATGTVMLPHVSNAYVKGEHEKTRTYLYKSFSFVTAISIPMFFGLSAVTPKFVPLFFTSKFVEVVPLMTIESIVILLIAWSNVIGSQYLLPTQQTKSYTISVVLGAVVNIIVNIPLIIVFGSEGAIIATVLSEITVTGYQLFVIRKQINYGSLFEDFYKYLISGFIMFCIIRYLNYALAGTWSMIILQVLVGIIVYVILMLIFKANIIRDAKRITNINK
ncbi:polysaccharide biosynthesis C-terminal domain-containing protein [Levilactobacillus spicheri]|uniref:Flippase n=1 Tax=Levilactobacillus spicheri TaxID=216463 RepID=A0A0F3RNR9_9LACO|nr:polysaccharide biosynthesis C-terminal domain-containing protein [Levilactobacillus spicheri]KJW11653.1 flippase [Levilactobacillus spicheri]